MMYDAFTQRVVRPMLLASIAMSALLLPLNFAFSWSRAQGVRAQAHGESFSDWAVNELSRRVTSIEGENLDGRLRVVESDMAELKWLSRSVAVAVIGQFAVAGMGVLKKRA